MTSAVRSIDPDFPNARYSATLQAVMPAFRLAQTIAPRVRTCNGVTFVTFWHPDTRP